MRGFVAISLGCVLSLSGCKFADIAKHAAGVAADPADLRSPGSAQTGPNIGGADPTERPDSMVGLWGDATLGLQVESRAVALQVGCRTVIFDGPLVLDDQDAFRLVAGDVILSGTVSSAGIRYGLTYSSIARIVAESPAVGTLVAQQFPAIKDGCVVAGQPALRLLGEVRSAGGLFADGAPLARGVRVFSDGSVVSFADFKVSPTLTLSTESLAQYRAKTAGLKAGSLVDPSAENAYCEDAPETEYWVFGDAGKVVIARESGCHLSLLSEQDSYAALDALKAFRSLAFQLGGADAP
jgi:hypothetical protein